VRSIVAATIHFLTVPLNCCCWEFRAGLNGVRLGPDQSCRETLSLHRCVFNGFGTDRDRNSEPDRGRYRCMPAGAAGA